MTLVEDQVSFDINAEHLVPQSDADHHLLDINKNYNE